MSAPEDMSEEALARSKRKAAAMMRALCLLLVGLAGLAGFWAYRAGLVNPVSSTHLQAEGRATAAAADPDMGSGKRTYPLPPAKAITLFQSSIPPAPAAGARKLSIKDEGFAPGKFSFGTWDTSGTPLSPEPMSGLVKEPVYRGRQRRYGSLRLGTVHSEPFLFVLDLVGGSHPILYFDANHDGDLTNDGGPILNQGTGVFGAAVRIPFRQVIREIEFSGDYVLWLFTNDQLWSRGTLAHYSLVSLTASIQIAGRRYGAALVDSRDNDADFTNDGVVIDLNRNGRFDDDSRVLPGQTARIDGRDYAFEVVWDRR